MTSRVKGFRWHRRAVDDYGIDFRHETFPRLAVGETLEAAPAPTIEITMKSAEGAVSDVTSEFGITAIAVSGDQVVFRKDTAATGEQDASTRYELLCLVTTSTGRRIASAHPLEVTETGDPDAP